MKGLGTDDSRLIRLIVTRCEVDMGEIKSVFLQQYGESLEDFISVSIPQIYRYISEYVCLFIQIFNFFFLLARRVTAQDITRNVYWR